MKELSELEAAKLELTQQAEELQASPAVQSTSTVYAHPPRILVRSCASSAVA